MGSLARRFFPTLRCYRLKKGNRGNLRSLTAEGLKAGPGHLDLRIGVRDWDRGDVLLRELQRILASAQLLSAGVTAEEFLQRYKNEQLRKGLV